MIEVSHQFLSQFSLIAGLLVLVAVTLASTRPRR